MIGAAILTGSILIASAINPEYFSGMADGDRAGIVAIVVSVLFVDLIKLLKDMTK
jgi:xanthine/uracil/vitamin C permease (AzgA family)